VQKKKIHLIIFFMHSETAIAHVAWKEPSWLRQYRERNAAIVKQAPLQKSKYSNIAFLEKLSEFPQNQAPLSLPFHLESSGVRVLSWEQALQECETELRLALENEFPAKDQFEAKVNAEFNSGFVLLAEKTKPNQLLEWELLLPARAMAKNVFIVRENLDSVHLLQSVRGENVRLNQTVFVSENASVCFASLFDFSRHSLVGLQSVLQQDSQLHSANAWMNGEMVRGRVSNVLNGPGSSIVQRDWNLGGKKDRLDLDLLLLHKNLATKSHSVFKSVLDESAYSVFEGMIKILPSGQQATAFLEAYGLLLSPNASNNNIPGLEIEADDVKATHSASVSHLDEEALFYLLSRGISETEAKQLVVMGFLESLVHELPKSFQEPLIESLEKKWKFANKN
jgi:Fe-S cluster assembly protein SufD